MPSTVRQENANDRTRRRAGHSCSDFYFESLPRNFAPKKSTEPARIRGGFRIFLGRRNSSRRAKARGASVFKSSIFSFSKVPYLFVRSVICVTRTRRGLLHPANNRTT